jgi:hypothetical protein
MVLSPEVLDLLDQLLLRMLDMDLVDALRCFYPCRTSLAWFLPITLQKVSLKPLSGVVGAQRCRAGEHNQHQAIRGRVRTFARAFLQLRHAFRVTDSGALRRFDAREELLLSAGSFSPRLRRGSDPVLSDVD